MATRKTGGAPKKPDVQLKPSAIYCVDVIEGLRTLPDESVDCVMTSPPYWALRDYEVEPTVWGGDPNCPHRFSAARRARPNARGTDAPLPTKNRDGSVSDSDEAAADTTTCQRCGAWRGVLGLEPEVSAYVEHLCSVFDEVLRVLNPTGTLWVNLGDTYHNATKWSAKDDAPQTIAGGNNRNYRASRRANQGLPEKCLSLIPARFALAMISRGWTLRNDIVWHKPNHMPSSVKDRFAAGWEHLFFFVKSSRYFFDLDAVRVPHKSLAAAQKRSRDVVSVRPSPHIGGVRLPPHPGEPGSLHPLGKNPSDYWTLPTETRTAGAILGQRGVVKVPGGSGWTGHRPGGGAKTLRDLDPRWLTPGGKNPGDAWDVNTRSFPGAHFAVFPEALCERPIKAGCPERVCKRCGTPGNTKDPGSKDPVQGSSSSKSDRNGHRRRAGPSFSCNCRKGFVPGLVLDPFAGTGTTSVVAKRLGRGYIGLELKPEYVAMANQRLAKADSARKSDPKGRSAA